MKSRRKKGGERPSALRWFKVMYPETYWQTRRPLWFEGTHLQVFQYSEQGIIPVIYQGKKKTTFLDPRAIVLTALTEKLSQVDYSPLGGRGLRAGLGAGHHAGEEGAIGFWVGMEPKQP